MIDLPGGYPPEWIGVLLLRPLMYAWSFGWFLFSIGLISFSAIFLIVSVGIMGGNLRSAAPASYSLYTATRFIWFLISRLRRLPTTPVQWAALVSCGTLVSSGVSSLTLLEVDGGAG